jgi:hypothetical protein
MGIFATSVVYTTHVCYQETLGESRRVNPTYLMNIASRDDAAIR